MNISPTDNAQLPYNDRFWLISEDSGGQPLTRKKINNFSW